MSNDKFAFGVDISRYNTSPDGRTKVDFDRIAAHDPKVVFIAMRTGVSWGYQDPWFAYYFAEAGRIGRARLAYHVLYPGESAQAQMDNLFRILGRPTWRGRRWCWTLNWTTTRRLPGSQRPLRHAAGSCKNAPGGGRSSIPGPGGWTSSCG